MRASCSIETYDITKVELIKLNACKDGVNWFENNGSESLLKSLNDVLDYNSSYAIWLIDQLLNDHQKYELCVYAAEQVLNIYEEKCPSDIAPKKALDAAKKTTNKTECHYSFLSAFLELQNNEHYLIANSTYSSAYHAINSLYNKSVDCAINSLKAAYYSTNDKGIQININNKAVSILIRDKKIKL